jgi:hypothetical protein
MGLALGLDRHMRQAKQPSCEIRRALEGNVWTDCFARTPTIDHRERLWDRGARSRPVHRRFFSKTESDLTQKLRTTAMATTAADARSPTTPTASDHRPSRASLGPRCALAAAPLEIFPEKICYARFVQLRGLNHGAVRTRSWVADEILMLTYLPPATCGVVCTSMTLPLNDPGSAVPAICRHTAAGMITDIIL